MKANKSKHEEVNSGSETPKDFYCKDYDSVDRFISYFHQIENIVKFRPKKILEVGIGNKTVYNYLKQAGFEITGCDLDPSLKPDVIGDVRKLPFNDNSFDIILACEILEHIPFKDVPQALSELKRVAKKNVIVSLPYSCAYLENKLQISIPMFHKEFNFVLRIPHFTIDMDHGRKLRQEQWDLNIHHWEIGRKGFPKARIRKLLKRYFDIIKEFHPQGNSYHYFFILRCNK